MSMQKNRAERSGESMWAFTDHGRVFVAMLMALILASLVTTADARAATLSQELDHSADENIIALQISNTISSQELVDMANKSRVEAGLPLLHTNQALEISAHLKASDMASKGYFAHNTPEGKKPWYWFNEAGYDYRVAGENLAVNFTTSVEIEQAWMNSPTHRENILNPEFSEIGISLEVGYYKGRVAIFVVEHFGSPRTSMFQF